MSIMLFNILVYEKGMALNYYCLKVSEHMTVMPESYAL